MTHEERQLARLLQQLEGRVTDLEQGRPPDAPEHLVETLRETGVEVGYGSHAIEFDGVDGTIEVANVSEFQFDPNNDDITWSFHLNPHNPGSNTRQRLIDKTNQEADYWAWIRSNDGHLAWVVKPDSASSAFTAATPIEANKEIWVSLEFDHTTGPSIYVNNQLRSSVNQTYTGEDVDSAPPDVYFGSLQDISRYFDGVMDDVHAHNRVLTEAERETIMNGGQVLDGLIGRWPMNDGSGSTVTETVNGNDGTISGGAAWTSPLVTGEVSGFAVDITEKTDFYFKYDVSGNGYDESEWVGDLVVPTGTTYTVASGAPERFPGADVDGTLVVNDTLILDG